jgi:hypothetical protein
MAIARGATTEHAAVEAGQLAGVAPIPASSGSVTG